MSTIASLQRMTARTLSEMILAEASTAEPSYAIVDVRDDGIIPPPPLHSRRLPPKSHLQGTPPTPRQLKSKTNTQKKRPHRRPHQDIPARPLHLPRRPPPDPPPQARRQAHRRLPLRPLAAARALRRPALHPRPRGRGRAPRGPEGVRAGPRVRGVGGGVRA